MLMQLHEEQMIFHVKCERPIGPVGARKFSLKIGLFRTEKIVVRNLIDSTKWFI